ncbi:putative T7SS-secreted protein [Streptomyces avermitilis]|uniref:putative T7SS-secreted protein n=1 Tax=Streptomyces avermitilis TaxID=33903 RepID=UPI003818F595
MGIGDIGDAINSGLGRVEDGIDAGKKLVGEGISTGAHVVGGGLESVGADGWADKVEESASPDSPSCCSPGVAPRSEARPSPRSN